MTELLTIHYGNNLWTVITNIRNPATQKIEAYMTTITNICNPATQKIEVYITTVNNLHNPAT